MSEINKLKGEIVIYKSSEGPEVKVSFSGETAWLTLNQIAELFGRDKSVISRHLKNVYKSGELSENSTVAKFATVQKEGGHAVERDLEYYNLDAIISVGYRVNSKRGAQFRIWATNRLSEYILKGYVLNEKRLKENQVAKLKELETAHKLIQQALENKRSEGYERELLRIITDYASTWFILNRYDEEKLAIEDVSLKKAEPLDYGEVVKSIAQFKKRLIAQKQANDLFGVEVGDKLKSALGAIDQTYNGKQLYPSVEEKAAHLLYFVIKDHPFVDGNKRIGSLLFLFYLIENHIFYNRRGERKISDNALVALALLVAESKPEQKDAMIRLIVNLINKK